MTEDPSWLPQAPARSGGNPPRQNKPLPPRSWNRLARRLRPAVQNTHPARGGGAPGEPGQPGHTTEQRGTHQACSRPRQLAFGARCTRRGLPCPDPSSHAIRQGDVLRPMEGRPCWAMRRTRWRIDPLVHGHPRQGGWWLRQGNQDAQLPSHSAGQASTRWLRPPEALCPCRHSQGVGSSPSAWLDVIVDTSAHHYGSQA